MLDLIEAKKRGRALSQNQIEGWIQGVVEESIPTYQTAALLMAIRLNGMTAEETGHLTMAMFQSGDKLEFKGFSKILDKHSTGGVGDKVTLILAPLVAACGVPVAMLSGRGLGFSGGTIDKFEAIEGVNCSLSMEDMQRNLEQIGWTNSMPTRNLAPADRIIYALRDVTATVDSLPLITASIMSKKLAGGASDLCLDVKCGQAAFMPDLEQARNLYHSLKENGERCGLRVSGLISRMEEPLGFTVGNYLEVIESLAILQGQMNSSLTELIMDLSRLMLQMAKPQLTDEMAREQLQNALADGSAKDYFFKYLSACGARDGALKKLETASFASWPYQSVVAQHSGVVTAISGRSIAEAARDLGAGRHKTDDVIDPYAGVVLRVSLGDEVVAGQELAWVYGAKTNSTLRDQIRASFSIDETRDPASSLDSLVLQYMD